MKRLLALMLCAMSLGVMAQTEYPYPYNPDGNNDGYISLNDLLDLLSVYGSEFNAGVLATDSISAVYYTGELDYYDCASSCVALRGNWKMLDKDLVGSYKASISNQTSSTWLDVRNAPNVDNDAVPIVYTSNWQTSGAPTNEQRGCFCQTRTRADIEDINVCEGLEDECGVCNGEGAIFECGCSKIPEGDCDCEGNQLDAIGVCGGDCLEDADGNGVCDPVLGPCEGQHVVSYNGNNYEIVETPDGRCWFAEDLRTDMFSNGNVIPYSSGVCEWPSPASVESDFQLFLCCIEEEATYAYPQNYQGTSCFGQPWNGHELSMLGDAYTPTHENLGHLYNWGAVASGLLCPSGFHVPSNSEWETLRASVSSNLQSSLPPLVSSNYLPDPDIYPTVYPCQQADAPIPNLPYGQSGVDLGSFSNIEFAGYYYNRDEARYWTSESVTSDLTEGQAGIFYLRICGTQLDGGISSSEMWHGYNVRCIKDSE